MKGKTRSSNRGLVDAVLTTCVLVLTLLILYWMGTLDPAGPEPLGWF